MNSVLNEDLIEALDEMYPSYVKEQIDRVHVLIGENMENEMVLKQLFELFEKGSRVSGNFEKKMAEARNPRPPPKAEGAKSGVDVLNMVRLPDPPEEVEPLPDITCPICFDDVSGSNCIKLKSCGHQYCLDVCYKKHLWL